jgi:hypothetical protein
MKRNKLLSIAVISVLLLALFSQVVVADQEPEDPEPECNPTAVRLADWMGVDCTLLLSYQAQGVGFGVIKQAYAKSLLYPELSWEELIARKMNGEGPGWGELKQAIRLALVFALNVDDLLARRAEGEGWGEIKQEYREGPGKPPWAGGPKEKKEKPDKPDKPEKPDDPDDPDDPDEDDKVGKGPPDWARPGKPPKSKP